MRTLIAAAAALGMVAVAAPAFAATQVGVGYTYADVSGYKLGSIDGSVSWDLASNFGVEVQGGFGVKGDGTSPYKVKENWNLAGYGTFTVPLSDAFSVKARAGYGDMDLKSGGSSKSKGGFSGGVGAQVMFNGTDGVRGDYTYQSVSGGHGNLWSVQYVHKFQ